MKSREAERKAQNIAAKVLRQNIGPFTIARYLGMSNPYTEGPGSRVNHPDVVAVKAALDELIVKLIQGSLER